MWYKWKRSEMVTEFWLGKVRQKICFQDLDVDLKMILTRILKKQDGRALTVFIYHIQGGVEGCYEHSCGSLGSIKCREFLA
jgi:hypothetical protein